MSNVIDAVFGFADIELQGIIQSQKANISYKTLYIWGSCVTILGVKMG